MAGLNATPLETLKDNVSHRVTSSTKGSAPGNTSFQQCNDTRGRRPVAASGYALLNGTSALILYRELVTVGGNIDASHPNHEHIDLGMVDNREGTSL
eukprot:CAMPEP_0204427644 /NCGR_PEP_ID=MMETSP0470-20130426/55686_1 /ASSEMBLY_ACC=CAM_ASM_000385 /TAXON_ID=2969 /ORGANISM="Oxyrrhis marina" /LENGTH=96 /DNA_ID=CAMNT_0051425467 /DNA_START=603 /DNA_END=889 /DNA_ORIENTATION=+